MLIARTYFIYLAAKSMRRLVEEWERRYGFAVCPEIAAFLQFDENILSLSLELSLPVASIAILGYELKFFLL